MLSDEQILQRYEEINTEIQSSVLGDVACSACEHWVESNPCEVLIKSRKDAGQRVFFNWKGRCHLNPPTPTPNRGDWEDASQFPETNADDHCSHFCKESD